MVEAMRFETDDPAFRGTMTMTPGSRDADGGTDVVVQHEGIPDGIAPADNVTGTEMALARLAELVE